MDQALFHMASPAGLAAGETTSVNLLAPAMILVNLPAMMLLAWVADGCHEYLELPTDVGPAGLIDELGHADVSEIAEYDETPCSEWDVRTLVHHLLYEQSWVPPLFEGLTIEQVGDRFDGDLMGDDASAWPGLLASSIEEAHAAVAQIGALDRTVHLSFGDVSGQEYVMQLTADLAIHAWDLAWATGRPTRSTPVPSRCYFPGAKRTRTCWQGRACSAHESTSAPTPRTTFACGPARPQGLSARPTPRPGL